MSAVDLDGGRAVGRHRGDLADRAREHRALLEEVEQALGELELLGDAAHRERLADLDGVEGAGGRVELVARTGDRVAVRAGGGLAEHPVEGLFDLGGDDVLPLARLLVGVGPREAEHVGEEALGEAVAAHDGGGELEAVLGEADGLVDLDETFVLHPSDHLGHRRP